MLGDQELIAFIATTDGDRAKAFYTDVLGLRLVSDDPFAIVFDAHGTMLRVQKAPHHRPLPHTALGWRVAAIADVVAKLTGKGVAFSRFDGMDQDAAGIWTAPGGAKIAWFKDPDGNVLSLTQF
jgi:catechol 2,3-dioxygenase-like lactoylglutathione lyase family enzyme